MFRLVSLCLCNFSKVVEYLKLHDTDLDLTSAIVLDYYVGGLWWCREQSYTAEQTSAFYTVINTLFHNLGIRLFSLHILSLLKIKFVSHYIDTRYEF